MKDVDFEQLDDQYGDKIPKRIQEYHTALTVFLNDLSTVQNHQDQAFSFQEDAPTAMGYLAYHLNSLCAKPFIDRLSDRYKIASITEVVISMLQPVQAVDNTAFDNRQINADFAFYCTINLLDNFRDEDESIDFRRTSTRMFHRDIANVELCDRMERVIQNHSTYLVHLADHVGTAPIIANSSVLEMIDLFYKFQWLALPN